jgi:hypothetical protein
MVVASRHSTTQVSDCFASEKTRLGIPLLFLLNPLQENPRVATGRSTMRQISMRQISIGCQIFVELG